MYFLVNSLSFSSSPSFDVPSIRTTYEIKLFALQPGLLIMDGKLAEETRKS